MGDQGVYLNSDEEEDDDGYNSDRFNQYKSSDEEEDMNGDIDSPLNSEQFEFCSYFSERNYYPNDDKEEDDYFRY